MKPEFLFWLHIILVRRVIIYLLYKIIILITIIQSCQPRELTMREVFQHGRGELREVL